jgi:hypothetical protein
MFHSLPLLLSCSPVEGVDPSLPVAVAIADTGFPDPTPRSQPSRGWVEVVLGYYHACASTEQGALDCWLITDQQSSRVPDLVFVREGPFHHAAAGPFHTCALDESGRPNCWGCEGVGNYGQCIPPGDSTFSTLFAGSSFTCGLSESKPISCWGETNLEVVKSAPGTPLQKMSSDGTSACGILIGGTLACWGSDERSVVSDVPVGGNWSDVATGINGACAISTPNNSISCWGGAPPPPVQENWLEVEHAAGTMCGILLDGTSVCWGSDQFGRASGAPSNAVDIAVGARALSAVLDDGSIHVWGCHYAFCDDGRLP